MIKKDFDFVMRALRNKDNKSIHLPALINLINNFKNKWEDNLGPGVADFYVKQLNKKYENDI
jgi:hypothetical protein|tara:strand:+ start:288 stop:473 length:186 start_codon:yes stop_codon:yes gene_type:complete